MLIKLLRAEGWSERQSRHGIFFSTGTGDNYRKTTIPLKNIPIPRGVLAQIVGPKQTGWGRRGLDERLKRQGLI